MQFGSWIPALHRTTRTRFHPGPRIPAIQPSSHPASRVATGPSHRLWMESLPENPGWWGVNPLPRSRDHSAGQWSSGPPLSLIDAGTDR